MKTRFRKWSACLAVVPFLGSCAPRSSGTDGKTEPSEKYGTIVKIGRLASDKREKVDETAASIYGMSPLYGLVAGSMVSFGGQAFGVRDSLKISLRMDDGSSRDITQKVKLLESFGIGDRVKVVHDNQIVLVKSAPHGG